MPRAEQVTVPLNVIVAITMTFPLGYILVQDNSFMFGTVQAARSTAHLIYN